MEDTTMDMTDLKSIQAPLKARYRIEPQAALVTLRASGSIGEGVTCSVETGRALAKAGLHPASGGSGAELCSGDMLLEALVACAGVTLNAVATSLGLAVRDARITAEGDIDFRGTLGVDKEAPVGFREIRLGFAIAGDLSGDQLATLIKLTERYCVVLQTLKQSPAISVTSRIG
jgi:uncharacterized OsmC-like protein